MRKRILGAFLLGAFTIASTSTFVSCKDYDDDISNLQAQINSLDAIKAAFNDGIIIKSVTQDGNGIVLALSNGDTYRISNGTNGSDADVWTIGNDGYWYKNGAKTDYKAMGNDGSQGADGNQGPAGQDGKDGKDGQDGKDGKDGVYYEPNADGYFYLVDPATGAKTKTNIQWSQASGISAAQTRRGVVLSGVDGYPNGLFLPTVQDLTSLVFIPDHYYWGVEATTIKSLTCNYFEPVRPLTTWIKADKVTETYGSHPGSVTTENSTETVGRRHGGANCKESQISDYKVAGRVEDHDRYPVKSTYTVLLNARARYHVNPTAADLEDSRVSIIDADKKYTRAEENAAGGPSAAGISLQGNASGAEKQWYVEDGILTVPLHINNTGALKKVANLTTTDPNDGVTIFATQVTWNNGGVTDTTVTSDYATLCEETVKDLRLSHTKHNRTGSSDVDFIQTKMFNLHCGDCTLPTIVYADGTRQNAYSNKGMHLFASIAEVEEYVTTTTRIDDAAYNGEGQDLVGYNENLNLNKLVETHYTNTAGSHDVFDAEELDKYFYYRFSLTSFIIGGNATNESAHACILTDEDGISYLHPLDPQDGGLLGRDPSGIGLDDWNYTTEVVVNRVPLVRVELVSREGNHVVDYGYIPIRITKEKKADPVKPELSVTFESYKIDAVTATRYAGCQWSLTGGSLLTNWRQTEEDLFALANKKLGNEYDILDRITFENIYDIDQTAGICNQYYIDASGNYQPVAGTPATMAVGTIEYITDTSDDGTHTSVFRWNVGQADVQTLAQAGITSIRRAVKFNSRDAANYPVIYVIFEIGSVSMKDITVKSDVNLKAHIIKEYLYAANTNTLGNDEIHTNVLTPEENVGDRTDITYDYNGNGALWDDFSNDRNKETSGKPNVDPTKNAWKPAYMDNKFSDVFVGNLRSGNNPVNWVQTGMTASEGSVPSAVSGATYYLDFVFDKALNESYHPKGYLDNTGVAKTFNLEVSANGKVLYAYLPSSPTYKEVIAEIVVDGAFDDYDNRWDNNVGRLQMMRIDYKRYKHEYAEALLNYKAHDELADDVIKATVALKAWYKSYTNEGSTDCQLTLENNTFDVRFLRPISIIPGSGADFTDAYVTGDGAQVIKISDLQPNYSDWRDNGATRTTNPSWKTNPSYDQYYAQNGKSTITFKLAYNFVNDTPISIDPNVTTDLNGNSTPVSLASVSNQIDLKYYDSYTDPGTGQTWNEPVIVYRNLSSTVDEFHVYIPVEVDYYWGKYYDKTTITIKKTVGNARQR